MTRQIRRSRSQAVTPAWHGRARLSLERDGGKPQDVPHQRRAMLRPATTVKGLLQPRCSAARCCFTSAQRGFRGVQHTAHCDAGGIDPLGFSPDGNTGGVRHPRVLLSERNSTRGEPGTGQLTRRTSDPRAPRPGATIANSGSPVSKPSAGCLAAPGGPPGCCLSPRYGGVHSDGVPPPGRAGPHAPPMRTGAISPCIGSNRSSKMPELVSIGFHHLLNSMPPRYRDQPL